MMKFYVFGIHQLELFLQTASMLTHESIYIYTNFMISVALLATLLSGQSSLSIWILLFVLNIYAKHITEVATGSF